jgi:hypothetical protein
MEFRYTASAPTTQKTAYIAVEKCLPQRYNIQDAVWAGFVQDAEKLDEDDFEKETAKDGVLQLVVVNPGEFDLEEPQSSSE